MNFSFTFLQQLLFCDNVQLRGGACYLQQLLHKLQFNYYYSTPRYTIYKIKCTWYFVRSALCETTTCRLTKICKNRNNEQTISKKYIFEFLVLFIRFDEEVKFGEEQIRVFSSEELFLFLRNVTSTRSQYYKNKFSPVKD